MGLLCSPGPIEFAALRRRHVSVHSVGHSEEPGGGLVRFLLEPPWVEETMEVVLGFKVSAHTHTHTHTHTRFCGPVPVSSRKMSSILVWSGELPPMNSVFNCCFLVTVVFFVTKIIPYNPRCCSLWNTFLFLLAHLEFRCACRACMSLPNNKNQRNYL